ncbi:MAG: DUF3343 domain-containing protein [Clostridiaceae bacterium]|nr:DUF3343 domain-containing protein [Clostridiaceae bacterium]
MSESEVTWFVLFENHTQGLELNRLLRAAGLHATIVPAPRALSLSCGVALALRTEELAAVREVIAQNDAEILKIASLEKDINPRRDRYC